MSDYTPGHALNDILVIVGDTSDAPALAPLLKLLYKAGQQNEREAIVASLYRYAELRHVGVLSHAAALISAGEL